MWFYTPDGYIVNLSTASRIYRRKAEDGVFEVAASIPGRWKVKTEHGVEERSGYAPVKLVMCGRDESEASRVIELFYRALQKDLPAADLEVLLDLGEGDPNDDSSDD